jgi:DNA end-binding protein Ku
LAEQLIDSWSDDKFNLAAYHNEYFEKVRDIIDDKVKGRETVEPEVEEEPEVINLMVALKKSMEHTVHRRRPATSTHRRRTTRSRSSGHRSTANRTASRAKSRSG